MTTSTATIADFLLARIGEDEAFGTHDRYLANRWGAECTAKRAIVLGHAGLHVCPNLTDDGYTDYSAADYDDGYQPCPTLRALASVYASHPDFNPDWS